MQYLLENSDQLVEVYFGEYIRIRDLQTVLLQNRFDEQQFICDKNFNKIIRAIMDVNWVLLEFVTYVKHNSTIT